MLVVDQTDVFGNMARKEKSEGFGKRGDREEEPKDDDDGKH